MKKLMNDLVKLVWLGLCLLAAEACYGQAPGVATPLPAVKPATDGKVWGALIYASKGEALALPKEVPGPLKDLNERLGKVFPFTRFELLGQHTQDIFRQYESWVVPSADLFLKLDSKGPAEGGGMSLNVQFWQEAQVLVK